MLAGSTAARSQHFVLHRAAPCEPEREPVALIGAMVPKRWAKRAVTRNAIKRQIYSVSADFESLLPVTSHVVRLRSGFNRAQFVSAVSDLLKVAVRAELQQLFADATRGSGLTRVQAGVK